LNYEMRSMSAQEREREREKEGGREGERPVRLNEPQINYSSLKPNRLSRQAEENEKRDAMATFTSARTARKYLHELARHLLPVLLCPSCSHGSAGNICWRLVIINSFRGLFIRIYIYFFFSRHMCNYCCVAAGFNVNSSL